MFFHLISCFFFDAKKIACENVESNTNVENFKYYKFDRCFLCFYWVVGFFEAVFWNFEFFGKLRTREKKNQKY
jgi:hypothetical protein